MSRLESKSNLTDTGRIRSSRACLICSRRKVKCDGLQPCNNCSKEAAICEYGVQKKRGPPKGCDARGGRRKKFKLPSPYAASLSSTSTSYPNISSSLGSIASSNPQRTVERPSQPYDQVSAAVGHSQDDTSRSAAPLLKPQVPRNDTPLAQRLSSDKRSSSDDRFPSTSYRAHDLASTAIRPFLPTQLSSISLLSTRDSHPVDTAPDSLGMQTHPYLQPQHHPDRSPSDHTWSASAFDSRHSLHPTPSTARQYNTYPLQSPLRDYQRSSPRASLHTLLPSQFSDPHSTLQYTSDHTSPATPSARSAVAVSAPTNASPRTHPLPHISSTPSAYDRSSTLPSSSTLSNRHPVSASRLTESFSTSLPAPLHHTCSSTRIPAIDTSPASTRASHDYNSSAAVVPHRPWYNGSRPSSPRGPASVPRSQISSPGAHWLDHHVRPSPTAADRSHFSPSYKLHLEDRLPPHIVQRLLDIYQTFVHPHWPIIYLPSFASLHSLKQSRPIVFEAILAVASNTFDAYHDSASHSDHHSSNPVLEMLYADSPQPSEPAYKSNELRDHFVQRVKTRIFEGKFAQDIATIQAAILISVIELGSGNTSSAFQFGGIACRMALDMNLHRCAADSSSSCSPFDNHRTKSFDGRALSPQSAAQLQERLRVFWACYIVDKILSTALGKPAQLRSAEIEADWPSVQEADEYDLWLNDTTRKFVDKSQLPYLEGVKVHALSSFKAWAEVMAILERILEEVYSPQAKRDRHRTQGASDYEALCRLNQRLCRWRANLPEHLKWSATWTSPERLSSATSHKPSADRNEYDAHRGLPPQILTMRSWYCICLILLHRPRVPNLIGGSKEHRASSSSDEPTSSTLDDRKSPTTGTSKDLQPTPVQDKGAEPAGLDICNAAAKEVCDILHVYGSSFRIRKISSSWVYLIFQAATIHAALAASKSVIVFKARQSSVWNRPESKALFNAASPSGAAERTDAHADAQTASGDPDAHRIVEAELEGSSELVKASARYLAQCVRYLKRIGPTWQSASHHVAVLRNLCIASAQARPMDPSSPSTASHALVRSDMQRPSFSSSASSLNLEEQTMESVRTHTHPHPNHHDPGMASTLDEVVDVQRPLRSADQHGQQVHQGHTSGNGAVPLDSTFSNTTTELDLASSQSIQPPFMQNPTYPADVAHDAMLATQQQQQQHQMMQQAMHMINANDSTFWASMPVASEGYNEWNDFFKTFNPGAVSDFASQHANYHPTATTDLITALQDPNRLLSGLQHP